MPSYFAYLGALNVVATVLVIEPDVVARGVHGSRDRAAQTYIDGSLYGRYAGPGLTFDPLNSVFTTTPISGVLATPVSPLDSRLEFSDAPAPAEKSFARLNYVRAIADGVNYKYCAPNARLRFRTDATSVELGFRFTKLTTHGSFNSVAEVFVDGVSNSTFTAPNNGSATATPAPVARSLTFGSAVMRLIEVVWPYGDSMDFLYLRVNNGATIAAPSAARPASKICVIGDSITQGFSVGKTSEGWPYKLGELKGRQIVNFGYGGRTAVSTDGAVVAGTGCSAVFYMIGTNDYNSQIAISTFQSNVLGVLQGIRAALPTAKIYASGPLYLSASLTIPASSYRSAVAAAVATTGDANATYIDGLALMTNNANRLSDGVHPNATGMSEIAAALAAIIK